MIICYTYVIRELWRSTRNMQALTNSVRWGSFGQSVRNLCVAVQSETVWVTFCVKAQREAHGVTMRDTAHSESHEVTSMLKHNLKPVGVMSCEIWGPWDKAVCYLTGHILHCITRGSNPKHSLMELKHKRFAHVPLILLERNTLHKCDLDYIISQNMTPTGRRLCCKTAVTPRSQTALYHRMFLFAVIQKRMRRV
jgi:hypothetical protein